MIQLVSQPINFEPVDHVYTLNGRTLPSVTQVMRFMSNELYEGIPPDVLAQAADRGTRAHEQIANIVRYDYTETDEDTQCYVDAYYRFMEQYKPEWLMSEWRTYHTKLMYAGTIDLIGYIEPDSGDGIDLCDIKCTHAYHPIMLATQLGAYKEAAKSQGNRIRNLYGLQLLKDGTFRFERVQDGFRTFVHCLALHTEMQKEVKP